MTVLRSEELTSINSISIRARNLMTRATGLQSLTEAHFLMSTTLHYLFIYFHICNQGLYSRVVNESFSSLENMGKAKCRDTYLYFFLMTVNYRQNLFFFFFLNCLLAFPNSFYVYWAFYFIHQSCFIMYVFTHNICIFKEEEPSAVFTFLASSYPNTSWSIQFINFTE